MHLRKDENILRLPIGISELRKKERVYVDKTKHAHYLITEETRTFLSRPRRFGKSLFTSTLEAILQEKKELFEGLWIADSNYHWQPTGVIRLDFSQLSLLNIEQFISSFTFLLKKIGEKNEVILDDTSDLNTLFMSLIFALHKKFPSTYVAILIDEYDYPILHTLHNPVFAKEIREIMKNFSSVIKGQAEYVQFVFVTGVSAFSKSGLSSGLNNLKNLTMLESFFDICGYTNEEVDRYFTEHMQAWSKLRNIPYAEVREKLKAWYNGYLFHQKTPTIYSPFSLTCALDIKEIRNFWFESATPQFLLEELKKAERHEECKFLDLDQFQGSMDLLQTFEIENIPLAALLFQMGYLTLDTYDPLFGIYALRYPNLEVKTALHKHLLIVLTQITASPFDQLMGQFGKALVQEDMQLLIDCLLKVFAKIPYPLYDKTPEKLYHAVVQALFVASGLKSHAEYSTSLGRANVIVELPMITYIFEIKVDLSPEKALKQIESQKYYEPFISANKPICAVGLSFIRKKATSKKASSFSINYASKRIDAN